MWSKHKEKGYKLAFAIIGYLFLSLIIAGFLFCVLYFTSHSIAATYFSAKNIMVGSAQNALLDVWIGSVCTIAASIVFIVLFLFMLGQRLSYLMTIIQGIESLREHRMNASIPLEGEDELTELAESINFLAATQRELSNQERLLKEEKDAFIRSLSHDIRTPLTSILSYSEFMKNKKALSTDEILAYITLMEEKAKLIKNLTDQLLGTPNQPFQKVEHVKLMLEQLAFEWEEILEEQFLCEVHTAQCEDFCGYLDFFSLRRIFDNLISNVEKYGERSVPVVLTLACKEGKIEIVQKNGISAQNSQSIESHKIGLDNIKKIAETYQGEASVTNTAETFMIRIVLQVNVAL